MSFILDALKKSEIERQRQSVPGLMDTGPLQRRARLPGWAIALIALLAVNLAVLVIVLAHGGFPGAFGRHPVDLRAAAAPPAAVSAPSAPTSVSAPAASAPPSASSASSAPAASAPPSAPSAPSASAADSNPAHHHFSPMDPAAPPVYAPEIPPTDEPAPAPKAIAAETPQRGAQSGATHGRERDPLLTRDDKSDAEVLPSISELNLTGADALPELHLDVHVYATTPAERFVYINMHKYREGSTLAEGPVLERIRRDGVVLDYHGLRFLLPRR